MAKGAANEHALGKLHSHLARIFTRVLEKYEFELEVLDKLPRDEIESSIIEELANIKEPDPRMLSAISKFLNDNNIGMDSEAVEELNSTQRRLDERRAARKAAGINLTVVPHVEAS